MTAGAIQIGGGPSPEEVAAVLAVLARRGAAPVAGPAWRETRRAALRARPRREHCPR